MLKKIRSLLGIIAVSSCSSDDAEHSSTNKTFQLKIYSEYGAKLTLDETNPNEKIITEWMDKLDWVNGFHQVSLHQDKSNWFEVGGSLDPSDGLSGIVSINSEIQVTPVAPTNVDEMKKLILSYYRSDSIWQS